MNRTNADFLLSQLRSWNHEFRFDMSSYVDDGKLSGRPSVNIAGAVCLLARGCRLLSTQFEPNAWQWRGRKMSTGLIAQQCLELTEAEGIHLFTGQWTDKPLGEITIEDAIRRLEELLSGADG